MGLIDSVILMVLGGLATVFIAVISRLLADDIKAWLPKLTDRYIEQAVKGLPEQERERFAEEWRSYVNDTPGDISKLVVAFGFLHASSRMARSARVSVQEIAVPTAERVAATDGTSADDRGCRFFDQDRKWITRYVSKTSFY